MPTAVAAYRHFVAELKKLVAKFDGHHREYLNPSYPEAQVRQDFIDPLFEALGWDLRNTQGLGRLIF